MDVALRAANLRKALFIEKPLSHSWEGVPELLRQSRGLVVEVGCQLRAHPLAQELKRQLEAGIGGRVLAFRGCVGQRLDQWRPRQDYRASYSAFAERGGGALFDLVHEIDLAYWFFGRIAGVSARLLKVSDLQIAADDLANLTLETAAGACGSLQMDMVSPCYRRSFEVICERAILRWDYLEGTLTQQTPHGGYEVLAQVSRDYPRNQAFVDHMRHFLGRLERSDTAPMCSLDDGSADLRIALSARAAAQSGMWTEIDWESGL
jgi:predicted dehydrogenase